MDSNLTASGPSSSQAITLASLIRREINAPVPPTAAKYTAPHFCMASLTSWDLAPLPIIPLSPCWMRRGAYAVHSVGCCRTCCAYGSSRGRRSGTDVINDLSGYFERQFLARVDNVRHSLMSRVSTGDNRARKADGVTRLQSANGLFIHRRGQVYNIAHNSTSACLQEWH